MPAARAGSAPRPAPARREPPAKKPRRRSDLLSRILVAIPLAVATIIFIDIGGLAFQLFLIAAGLICLHECYRAASEPGGRSRWSGSRRSSRWCSPPAHGGQGGVLEVAVAAVPVVVLAGAGPRAASPDGRDRRHAARDLLDRLRVRARRAAARAARTATASLIDVLVGNVRRRHRRVRRRQAVRAAPARAHVVAEQDRRGPGLRHARRDPRPCSSRASTRPGSPRATRCCSAWRSRCSDRSVTCSSRWSSATRAPRTPAACSAPTAARSTGSTPRCSRSWSATTSGSPPCALADPSRPRAPLLD